MGRGLSDLQKWILWRAAEQAHVTRADVLLDYYDLPPSQWSRRAERNGLTDVTSKYWPDDEDRRAPMRDQALASLGSLSRSFGDKRVLSSIEGGSRYRAASAATSRSFKRLRDRAYLRVYRHYYPGGPGSGSIAPMAPQWQEWPGAFEITDQGYGALAPSRRAATP